MQNLIRFNGHFGCSWCYHQGKYDAHQVRYPILDTYQKRTDASTRLDTSKSLADERHVRGVKGPSCLFNLPEFNLIEGYVPDYMHCVCLGVTKMLLDMWTSTKNHAEQFYIGRRDQLANINSRLLSIRPPREVSRLPRTVKVKSDWKASEWRSWLLFYGVPCLTEVLHTRYLSHFALLSSAIYLLIQDSITPHQLQVADGMLFEFVVNFQLLYGVSCMTFNVHQLLHMTRSVRNWGPLWAHSAFPFEDWNGRLLKLVHGTRSAANQVAQRLSVAMTIEALMGTADLGATTTDYCHSSLGRTRIFAWTTSGDGITTGLGTGCVETLGLLESAAMARVLVDPPSTVTSYQRVVHDGILLSTTSRPTKRCDAFIVTDGGIVIEICKLVLVSRDDIKRFFLLGRQCEPLDGDNVQALPQHLKTVQTGAEMVAVPSSLIKAKCVAVMIGSTVIIGVVPTRFLGD